jgi:phosphoribosylglycinamide formyltransferase-1
MKKIVVLVSGNGGNLRFLYHFTNTLKSRFHIKAAIADRACGALDFCIDNGIDNYLIPYNRKNNDNSLYNKLKELNPDFIVCHIHKILDEKIVHEFEGKLINLHYSILPNYKGIIGLEPIIRALANKDRVVGVTCHYLIPEVDAGKTIANAIIEMQDKDTLETISDVVFRSGCLTLINSLKMIDQDSLNAPSHPQQTTILKWKVTFSSKLLFDHHLLDESFWQMIKDSSSTPAPVLNK